MLVYLYDIGPVLKQRVQQLLRRGVRLLGKIGSCAFWGI